MKNSFYKFSLCFLGVILFWYPVTAQLSALVSPHGTTCNQNNGSAMVTPSGGSGYTYQWSTGGSITDTISGLAAGNYTVTVYSGSAGTTTVYSETFGPPAPAGWTLNVSTGANAANGNFWEMDDVEGGQAVGACGGDGAATGNGNYTLYVTNAPGLFNVPGCAYDAGGIFNVTSNMRTQSPNISTVGYAGMTLNFQYLMVGQAGFDYMTLEYSTDGGVTWTNMPAMAQTPTAPCGGACGGLSAWTAFTVALPPGCNNIANLQLGFNWQNNNDGVGCDPPAAIDNITITTAGAGIDSVVQHFTIAPSVVTPTPTTGAVTPPTCAMDTGWFIILNYNAADTYAVSPSSGVYQNGDTIFAPPGNYTLTATTAGCPSAASGTVTVPPSPGAPPQPTTGAVTQPVCPNMVGTFTITNYNAAYTYIITPAGTIQAGSTVTASQGSYTITASLGGCTSAASASVTVNAPTGAPAQPTTGPIAQPTCASATGSFAITNYSILYTYSFIPNTGVSMAGSIVTAPPGTYIIFASQNACASAPDTVVVDTVPTALPQPTTGAVTQPTCATPDGTFSITNYNATYTYTITPNTGVTQTAGTVTAPAGTYTITASLGGCTSAASAPVTVNPAPGAPAQPTTGPVTQPTCASDSGTFTITNYNALYTYTFIPNTGVSMAGGIVTAPPGSYTITATNAGCVSVASAAVTVNAPAGAPAQPTIGVVTQPTCTTDTGTFTITNYNAAYTYTITPNTGVTNNLGTVTAPAGSYTITATNAGCTSTATPVTINAQPTAPTITITAANTSICAGALNLLTANGAAGGAYVWSGSNTTYSGQVGNSVNMSANTAGASVDTVTWTGAGCTTIATITITSQTVSVTLSQVTQPTCGHDNGTISFSLNQTGVTDTFRLNDSIVEAGSQTLWQNDLPPGVYTFQAYDPSTGCYSPIDTVILTDTTTYPVFTNVLITPEACFGDDSGAVTVTVANCGTGCLYSWSNNSADTTTTATGLAAGIVTFAVSKGACTNIDTPITIPGPLARLTDSLQVRLDNCSLGIGAAIALPSGGTAPYTYTWSAGTPSADSASQIAAGTLVSVTVTDAHQCSDTSSGLVVSATTPTAVMDLPDTICLTESNGQLTVTPTSADGPFTYLWSTGATTPEASGLSPGTYTVSVYDAAGCDVVVNGTVAFYPTGTTLTTLTPGIYIGQTAELVLTTEVGSIRDVTWSPYIPGSTGSLIANVSPDTTTTYTSILTYGLACQIIDTITIYIKSDTEHWTIPNTFTPNGDGLNDLFFLDLTPNLSSFHIWIYDRWGNKVFESTDAGFRWDGTDQFMGNKPLNTGVFAYIIEYHTYDKPGQQKLGGNISLVR